jgi:hypothetical protein
MRHIEQYIEVLKKRAAQPSVVHASERIDPDLPGLRPKGVVSPERLMSLKNEYTRVLVFFQAENKRLKAARGKARKDLGVSMRGSRARLSELSLLIGIMTPEERTFGFGELMHDAK